MIIKETQLDRDYLLTGSGELSELTAHRKDGTEALFHEEIKRAFSQGRDEGEQRGYAKAREELHHLSLLLHTLADYLVEHRKKLIHQIKPEIVELSFQIAETLIRHELSQPNHLLALIQALLNQAVRTFSNAPLKLFLSPEDLSAIEKLPIEHQHPLTFLADPKLRPGDCRIECETGVLNAEIARELHHLKGLLIPCTKKYD